MSIGGHSVVKKIGQCIDFVQFQSKAGLDLKIDSGMVSLKFVQRSKGTRVAETTGNHQNTLQRGLEPKNPGRIGA